MSHKDYEPFDLAAGGFLRHELERFEIDNICNAFGGLVEEVLGKINDGKEATVYLCRGAPRPLAAQEIPRPYLAAKIYRARKFRSFENDHRYRNFGKMRDRRMAKAMRGKTRKGQRAFHSHWIDSEWKCLRQLWSLGVSVPQPYMHSADGVLMEFIGNESGAAPRLINCRLAPQEAENLLAAIMADVETMITHGIVHGDLSAYNILYDGSRHTIIDVPQAVDAATAADALQLLQRDLINVGKYFGRYGLEVPVEALMRRWR